MTTMRSMRMMKARNGQTQDNRSPESIDDGELWAADASLWRMLGI